MQASSRASAAHPSRSAAYVASAVSGVAPSARMSTSTYASTGGVYRRITRRAAVASADGQRSDGGSAARPSRSASTYAVTPRPKVTSDPERSLGQLFRRYVERYVSAGEPQSRDDGDIWRAFTRRVREPSVLHKLQARTVASEEFPSLRIQLDHTWKNGIWHAAYPLSLDLSQRHAIVAKASSLVTSLGVVRPREQEIEVTVLVGLPDESAPEVVRAAARDGFALLRKKLADVATVLPEAEADGLAERMVRDLTAEGHG